MGKGYADMKKRFRKITTLLLTLALVCSLLPGTALGADRAVNTSISAASQDKTLRILAVGNSFSVDSLQYLYQMGKSAGYDLVIGNLYHEKSSLAEHWNRLNNQENGYTYYKISAATNGVWSRQTSKSIQYGVKDEPWDIITLQQASGVSGVPSSYADNSWTCKQGDSISLPAEGGAVSFAAEPESEQANVTPAETVELAELEAEAASQKSADTLTPSEADSDVAEDSDATPSEGDTTDDATASTSGIDPIDPPTKDPAPERTEQTIICGIVSRGESSSVSLKASAKTGLTYTSSNLKVAVVDEKGRITFRGNGTATITITAAQSQDYYGAQKKVDITNVRSDYVSKLQKAIKKRCSNKSVRFGWNMTWAYAQPSQWKKNQSFLTNYQDYYNQDQMTMYTAITDTVAQVVAPVGGFAVYIPTGTAIQNLRSSYVGDKLNRDGVHLNWSLGRYTAAMTWAAALGIDVNQITYRPSGSNAVSPLDVSAVRASVTDAIKTPLAVTQSSCTTAPTLNNTEKVTLTNEAGGVRLTWKKAANATGYRIWRKTGNGSFKELPKITKDKTTTYLDTAVQKKSGVTYTYSIRAVSGSYMAPANQRKTILRLSSAGEAAANEKNGIKLTWSKVTGAEGYRIYRGNSGGEETTLKTVTSTVTAYTDKTVVSANGKSYTYTVQPYSGQWDGSSEGVSTVRLTGVTLKKAAKAGSGIKLTWTRNSKAKGYEIYRKMNGGKWTKVKTITKNSTLSCVDKAVKHGKTYSYKVCAYKDTSTSQLSNTKTVKR